MVFPPLSKFHASYTENHSLHQDSPPLTQKAYQPDLVKEPSDCHSISMMPVVEVTGLGMVDPECPFSSTVFDEHDMLVQLLSVILSKPASVSKSINAKVMAAGYDTITDRDSELP
jgi:hypothetical protein